MDQQKDTFFPRPFLKTEPIIVVVPIKTEPETLMKRADKEDCESDNSDKSALQSDGELFSVVQVTLFLIFRVPITPIRLFGSVDVSNMKRLELVNSTQPIRTSYLGHVIVYQPIRDSYLKTRSVLGF